ncbi:MFS transporter [Streptomyces sp. NBC_01727]|uniref:MFS transporter n=1 Tax=Streptomyces sp. NBC_01727 TaxID=2975924 RepID=UPI002E0E5746|nr:MFS transporter [Streptomyces sp. NBC_01727]
MSEETLRQGLQSDPPPPTSTEDDHSRGTIAYVSVICGLAWIASVYDFTLFGTVLPVIADEFGWTPADATMINTISQVGIFLVSLVPGLLIDRLGRRKTLIFLMVGGAVVSGITGIAVGAVSLILIRSLSGLSLAEEVVNAVYLSEMLKKVKNKGFVYSLVQGGWPIGALVGAAVCSVTLPLIGWRWSFCVAAAATLLIIPFALRLPESKQFQKVTASVETYPSVPNSPRQEGAKRPGFSSELRQLFSPTLRRHTTALCSAWLFNWFGNQVLTVLGTTILVEAKGIPLERSLIILIVSNVTAFIGYLVHGWLGDRVGRRNTIIRSWLVASAVSVGLLLGPNNELFVFVAYSVFLFFQLGPYAALLFYMGESFPVQVRGSGANLAHALAPVGSIFGSGLLGLMLYAHMPMSVAAVIAGSLFIGISAVCLLFADKD